MEKILFFISSMEDGGAQRVISKLSNEFVERGFDVEILKYFKGDNNFKLDEKVKVNSVEELNHSTNIIKSILFLKKYFKNNANIVLSFLAPFNIIALLSKGGTPMIVADRNDPRKVPSNKYLRFVRDRLYRKANAIVLQTNANKAYFDEYIQRKSHVIPNPINIGEYKGVSLNSNKEKLIVSVGRLEKQKNQILLIDSFNEILKKHQDYKLVIYGEGNYRKELESRIRELNIEAHVTLPGSSKKVFEDIKSAEMFVLSSDYEGMPNALMEAMCLGLPVISTKVSGAIDLINNGVNGLLVDINDKNNLIKSINKLIEDKEYARRIAENATNLNEELEINKIVDEWLGAIKEVLNV